MMQYVRRTGWVALTGLVLALAAPASAATCSVDAQGVSFGSYNSLSGTSLDSTGNIHVNCDASVSFTVSLGPGSGSFEQRLMSGGADQLGYNLYTDASRTTVWGDGVAASSVSATATSVDLPVYGRIPGRQNVPANVYGDSITVTVAY